MAKTSLTAAISVALLLSSIAFAQTYIRFQPELRTNWDSKETAATFNSFSNKDLDLLKDEMSFSIMIHLIKCRKQQEDGFVFPAYLCKDLNDDQCRDKISLFVDYIVEAAKNNDLNPWLLAAVAYNESRFNPFASGGLDEQGLFQLHPKSKRGKHSLFVTSKRFRNACKRIEGNCQKEITDLAADHIRSAINKCGGSWQQGLSMYNGGTCKLRNKYLKKTLAAWKMLEGSDGLQIPWCKDKI